MKCRFQLAAVIGITAGWDGGGKKEEGELNYKIRRSACSTGGVLGTRKSCQQQLLPRRRSVRNDKSHQSYPLKVTYFHQDQSDVFIKEDSVIKILCLKKPKKKTNHKLLFIPPSFLFCAAESNWLNYEVMNKELKETILNSFSPNLSFAGNFF